MAIATATATALSRAVHPHPQLKRMSTTPASTSRSWGLRAATPSRGELRGVRRCRRGACVVMATDKEGGKGGSEDTSMMFAVSAATKEDDALERLELAVPRDQRPSEELKRLSDQFLFSWAALPLDDYLKRFGIVWALSFFLLAAPISSASFDPATKPLDFFLCALAGSSLLPSFLLLRVYLGWSYVSKRLLSAKVYYEETGWYDGQIFVKPPEILARDRLLGTYQVNPLLAKLRNSMFVGTGTLVACVASLLLVPAEDLQGNVEVRVSRDGDERVVYKKAWSGGEAPPDLADDDAGAAIAMAAGQKTGLPAYCGDRYYKAMSGGVGC